MTIDGFSPAVMEALGFYVYLLKDPVTDEIFYIGKGTGNRIFAHLNQAISEGSVNAKLDRIRTIHERGQEVKHIIHRHGMKENEALEVEAALIDLVGITDLTNLVGGHHSENRGAMTISEVIATYDAPVIEIQEAVILVVINNEYRRAMPAEEIYKVTQGSWRLGERREKATYVFAVANQLVRQIYKVEKWYPVIQHSDDKWYPINASDLDSKTQIRWNFKGHIAKNMQSYIGGSVERYITQGAQNPIKYVNC